MEFLLDSLYYLYNYYIVCILFSHTYHVTYYVISYNDFLFVWLWLCDTYDIILSHTLSCVVSLGEKERKKKRNINNDLAILPSHNNL